MKGVNRPSFAGEWCSVSSLKQAVQSPSGVFERKRLRVRGIVQGVGFRPFVFGLAGRSHLAGFVRNTPDGVLIEIEGDRLSLASFLRELETSPPPLARITGIATEDLIPEGETGFAIRESVEQELEAVLVSPDVATCDDCRREFTDPADRRLGYPFTNCTNCGPRYSIIQGVPYDRPRTTMAAFRMCPACQAEYDDPANRRFHAQPNACPSCGPRIALVDGASAAGPESCGAAFNETNLTSPLGAMAEVRQLLRAGEIVAIKGLGGFHLACDAENHDAVRRLRERKRRSDKPFAVMSPNVSAIEGFCVVSSDDQEALTSARRPIVILPRRPGSRISPAVAPGNNTLGVMLPYTPLHSLLFGVSPDEPPAFTALVLTSGNLSEEPIVTSNDEALARLGDVADRFLIHNRDIHMRVDDSVVRVLEGKERVLRRSRGFVPSPIDLGVPMEEILACGSELKNTLCLTRGRYAIVSQHIGDLENFETLVFFEETLANLKRLFRINPRVVAYDLHPRYLSTQFALEQKNVRKIGVQHHHAHIASCMAENSLREKVIGVAFDGTGYGTDRQIWGGEFLVADFAGFERRAHLRYVPLAGGDTAIRQPWRSALSYLRDAFGSESLPAGLPFWKEISPASLKVVETMLAHSINTVMTSSCGRLFDAVASILGLRQEINFEAQAAIELEMAAGGESAAAYPFEIESTDPWQIDLRPMIRSLANEILRRKSAATIAARFHRTLAVMIAEVCRRLRKRERLNQVCLSGGTFQNMLLLQLTLAALRQSGFEVYLHSQVPPNDGGISLGQALIANAAVARGDSKCA
jgi:hydrogenase maturation protein HypF